MVRLEPRLMAMQLRPCYDLGDAVTLLYRFYIKYDVHLIYVLLNVGKKMDRHAQVAMHQLAIMDHIHYVG